MVEYKDIVKNYKEWNVMSEKELDDYANKIFKYYREHGYPYYNFTDEEKKEELNKLSKVDTSAIIENNVIRQTMHGLGFCWSYFSHAIEIRNLTSKSPLDIFMDDRLLMTAIKKRLRDGTNMSDAALRKSIRKYGGVGVSNFRPTAACAIYNRYGGDTVWDMSGGFGGRMVGAFMSDTVKTYIATDPAEKTFNGLVNMAQDIRTMTDKNIEFKLFMCGSEEFLVFPKTLDLCFTSPPYFNTERYSDEDTQSYKMFPILEDWLKYFWRGTVRSCFMGLKPNRYLVFNIANVKTAPNLAEDCLNVAKSVGFEHIETLQLQLSGRPHTSKDKEFKYEPVFVMKKQEK